MKIQRLILSIFLIFICSSLFSAIHYSGVQNIQVGNEAIFTEIAYGNKWHLAREIQDLNGDGSLLMFRLYSAKISFLDAEIGVASGPGEPNRETIRFSSGQVVDNSFYFGGDQETSFLFWFLTGILDYGNFRNQTGFVALQIPGGDGTHYGWARISVTGYDQLDGTVTLVDWAYEDQAGKGIKCGQTDYSLPVELHSFTANATPEGVKLKWVTESEVDNLGFILERARVENNNQSSDWYKITSYKTNVALQSGGNTSERRTYYFDDVNVRQGDTWSYRLSEVDIHGTVTVKDIIVITVDAASSIFGIPENTELLPATPNPFNPSTRIQYKLSEDIPVTLEIIDILGRKVMTLLDHVKQSAGAYSVHWNGVTNTGVNAPSGIYLIMLHTGNLLDTQKIMLVR